MRTIAFVAAVVLLATACSSTTGDTTTTSGPADTTTTTSTTSSVTATSTTSATTTTTTASTTTTTTEGPVLHVAGSTVVYTPTGEVVVQGWVEGPATVTVGWTEATTYENPGGRTDFSADLVMDVGTADVEIVATDPTGASASETITIVTDPDLVRQFAFITAVDPESNTLEADYAEWFTGEEAAAAAIADGEGSSDGTYDLDFYIRNRNDRLRTLDLAPDADVVLIVCYEPDVGPCVTTRPVGVVTFGDLLSDPDSALTTQGWYWYGAGDIPYWLTLSDDVVIQIEEQYLP